MLDNFKQWMNFSFFWECGGAGEPRWKHEVSGDPGKLTIYGISQKAHPRDIAVMKEMTKEDARKHAMQIAKDEYWELLDCDIRPHGMDIVIADIGFNQGVSRAKEILRCSIDWRDAEILRLDRYDDLKTLWDRFGDGWAKRLVSLRDFIVSDFTILEWDRKDLVNGNAFNKEIL